ncbi:MAG: hypothetical protein IJ041_01305 [Clostridia bacterium]|nr:hypothetical protein [Clostridia bacterium]
MERFYYIWNTGVRQRADEPDGFQNQSATKRKTGAKMDGFALRNARETGFPEKTFVMETLTNQRF